MLILPVIDLKKGVVVLGRAGRRETYRPVRSRLCRDAQPASVSAAFARAFGFQQAYLADLDAIEGAEPNWSAYEQVAQHIPHLWIDAGVADVDRGRQLVQWGGDQVSLICGLESLPRVQLLRDLLERFGPSRVVFSLDLIHGQVFSGQVDCGMSPWQRCSPQGVADDVIRLGVQRMVVLDVARVGEGQGTGTRDLIRLIRRTSGSVQLVCGGGLSTLDELRQVWHDGCNGVLLASALHDGRLDRAQLDQLSSVPRRSPTSRLEA